MNIKSFLPLLMFWGIFSILSCGDKPISEVDLNILEIKLPSELEFLIGDSAQILIYGNGKLYKKGYLKIIREQKDFFIIDVPIGEWKIDVFITGPNENVVYLLDRKKVNIRPDFKNTVELELQPPIKFDTKIVNISPNSEVIVTAKVDNSRLPEGLNNPQIKWTIDNIEGGNSELGIIISNGNTATIKGPPTLPSSQNHYLGAYYEANSKKYISVIKINYVE
ncbi:MAG: hypothetical protein N2746_06300 [Deltaproteobacteria bacterium]|nr:hypothetical protein [Deltaproteobacteria bacterium]